jgi:hypothetical protein
MDLAPDDQGGDEAAPTGYMARMLAVFRRPVTGLPPAVMSHAIPQYAPTVWRPEWLVGHLVYQGGVPILKRSSLTGGGFIPSKSFAGKEALSWQPYATPVSSVVGGGQVPSRPNFTTPLANGQAVGNGV